MRLWLRRAMLLLLVLSVGGAIGYAFLPKPVGVDLAPVTRGNLRVTVDEDGKTRIKERYVISSPLAGRMNRILLKAGDEVKTKQMVALVMPTDPAFLDDRARAEAEARVKGAEAGQRRAAANYKRAQLTRQFARAELIRARGLHAKGISAQELEHLELKDRTAAEEEQAALFAQQMADYELELAQAALVRSRPASPGEAELKYLEISSPISGRVLRVFQESETVVTVGQHLLEVGDPETLECEIDVLSADAVKIKEGAPAFLEHWGGEKPLKGHVRRVEPAGFTKISALGVEEQRVWVIIDFDDPREARQTLGDAFRVEARIVIWEGKEVLKVPASALFRKGDGWAVFLAQDGRAVLQVVSIGHSNGLEAEVLDGLQVNDQVVVHPSDKIKHDVGIVPR